MTKLIHRPSIAFDDFNRLFDIWNERNDVSRGATSAWHPSVDIKETPAAFILLADLPGVSPNDVSISMENNVLTLRGERNETKKSSNDDYSRVERIQGTFFRQFTLPDFVDSDKIHAKSKHGVLEVTIPKVEKARSKRIDIRIEN